MVTILDIAREAGISSSTVSRALGDHPGTNAETRKRIRKLAREMGYDPNRLARSLVTQQTKMIGLVFPDLTNPFFTTILSAMETIANEHGYSVLISCSYWDEKTEEEELNVLFDSRVDGIFLYACSQLTEERVKKLKVPLVIGGQQSQELTDYTFVNVDHRRSLELAVQHMVECGYERLAYLGGNAQSPTARVRLDAFKAAAEKEGLALRSIVISEGDYAIQSGYERGVALLSGKERPNGIICGDDLIALGVMQAAAEQGINVPEELGIIGYDDVLYASLPQIMLSTVRVPCEEIGKSSMELLFSLMTEEKPRAGRQVLLFPDLIVRKTTQKIK
ncbi:MAG: LacI family DNA-binding transcriptional regulator [Clostridia bacterium]|nr:LacI family DNA-binding transcriptional regulator [Clostridia bacterium]